MIVTAALGVQIDPFGRLVVVYKNDRDETVVVDITSVVQSAAEYVFLTRATSVRATGPTNGLLADNRFVN